MNAYLWVKALHIVAVIAWMAGMLYLPRLFVYHVRAAKGSELSETLKIMERKLLRFIINPAMIATFILGIWLISISGFENFRYEGWLHAKLTLVFFMVIVHIMLARWRRKFDHDQNIHSEKFFRIINEVPAVLMAFIVILAVVKPF